MYYSGLSERYFLFSIYKTTNHKQHKKNKLTGNLNVFTTYHITGNIKRQVCDVTPQAVLSSNVLYLNFQSIKMFLLLLQSSLIELVKTNQII